MKKINEDKMTFMQDILGIHQPTDGHTARPVRKNSKAKQLDPGSSNIALGGVDGHFAVRLQDKVSRNP